MTSECKGPEVLPLLRQDEFNTQSRSTPNVPMERMDRLLERLVDRVLDTERVTACLKDYLRTQAQSMPSIDTKVGELNRALKAADDALNNLYRGIELGIVPLDSTLQARMRETQAEVRRVFTAVVG